MQDVELDEEKTSKYNSAIDQLRRIGEIWRIVRSRVVSGDYFAWNQELDRVWVELSQDVQPNGKEEKDILDYNKKIVELQPLATPNSHGFNKISEKDRKKYSEQYLILISKEIYIRRLQNRLGKGTAYLDDDEDLIE